MNNVNYEGPQTKFNLIVKELPKFKSISHIYNGNETYDEVIQKSKAFLTGTIHMGCSNLNEIHSAYLDVANFIFQF